MVDALDGIWRPPVDPDRSDLQRVAAARLRFYAYQDRNGWFLVTSGTARRELLRRDEHDWVLGFVHDLDFDRDAPRTEQLEGLTSDYESSVRLKQDDALHLARVQLRPWIRLLITNDDRFRARAARLDMREGIELITALEAEARLKIEPGETPPIAPLPGSPLARIEPWWVPWS